jgi:serine/threonine protein kinase
MGNNTQKSYEEQLSSFASELRDHIDDEAMLQEIHVAIKAMLSGDGVSEQEVRDVLQQHHDKGDLREESFQLVQKLIDNIVSEELPTATIVLTEEDSDPFGSTTVIPTVTLSPALADQQLQVGSVLRDRFMLAEEIPGGNMGTVYKALDRRLAEADEEEHWVAVKVLSPRLSYDADALRALQQEAVKTRCLSHPNIVRFIDLDRDDDLYFMVMEWLEGQSLATILDDSTNHQIDLATALDIVRQIGHALDYAHLRGVIHADVKPGNIMIMPSGQAKLFDFGIARIRQKQSEDQNVVDPGTLKAATPAYSSMQVLTGEEPVAADDVFSLACLAYRLIAGYRVFGPRNAAEAAEAGMKPQRLEVLSNSQWQALKKALAYSRVARYSSSAEFVKALTASSKMTAVKPDRVAAPDDVYIEEFDTQRRRPWRYVALALIFAAAAAVVFEDDLIRIIRPYFNEAVQLPFGENPATESEAPPAIVTDDHEDAAAEEQFAEPVTDQEKPAREKLAAEPKPLSEPDVAITLPEESKKTIEESTLVVDQPAEAVIVAASTTSVPPPGFSNLPPADIILPLAGPGELPETSSIKLVEDGAAVIIDFVRGSNLEEALQLELVERHGGNQTPMGDRQYNVSNDGVLEFPSGQHRARLIISMKSDSVRESDHHVALVVLDTKYADTVFASIGLTLQDDDQRAYESRLAPNTVAFAVSEVTVRESDAAIQMDVIRYKPDSTRHEVDYVIRDVTTVEGEDYIAPFSGVLSFGPGERSVRILIPLIQDSSRESDESFTIDLVGDRPYSEGNIYRRITVIIRDDDT